MTTLALDAPESRLPRCSSIDRSYRSHMEDAHETVLPGGDARRSFGSPQESSRGRDRRSRRPV